MFGGKPLKWTFRVGDQPPTLGQGIADRPRARARVFGRSLLSVRCQQTLSLPPGSSDRPQGPWQVSLQRHPRTFHGTSITAGPFATFDTARCVTERVRRSDQRARDARVSLRPLVGRRQHSDPFFAMHRQRPLASAALLLSDFDRCPLNG